MEASLRKWAVDLAEPRAPDAAVWDAMTPEEREQVYAMLPENPYPLCNLMGEGDRHRKVASSAADALDHWLGRRRRAYVGRGSTVYYPGEAPFAPDVYVVLDAEPGERSSWLVSREGRGLDVVIEIHHLGERLKDVRRNVEWLARLGIPEYFVIDIARARLSGWRLQDGGSRYERLLLQRGHLVSDVLGLEIGLEKGRARFYSDGAVLPDQDDLIARLVTAMDAMTIRAEEEARRAEEEARRAEEEARRADAEAERANAVEKRLAELLARLSANGPKDT